MLTRRALAAALSLLIAACASPPSTITRVARPAPVVARAPMRCAGEYPGMILALGEQALVVDSRLAAHYYHLRCSHPAVAAFAPDEEHVRGAVEALEVALAREGRRLDGHSLHILGVTLAPEAGAPPSEHVYIRADACPPDERWMAPSPVTTPERASCVVDALYSQRTRALTVRIEAPLAASADACADPVDPSRDRGRMSNPCRFGVGGTILPIGRGTFIANEERAGEIYGRPADAYFAADEASARAALRAVEARFAFAHDRDLDRPRRLDDYHLQVAGFVAGGARRLSVAGACRVFRNRWLHAYMTAVSDGGMCFFDAEYDLARGELVSFTFHGEA